MSYIAWDTETTGLPPKGFRERATKDNIHAFDGCRMVSIAFVKFDADGNEIDAQHIIVKPDDFTVGATHIHGITHEHALEHGVPFDEVYDHFVKVSSDCTALVAHNSEFDENVLFSECYRRGKSLEPFKKISFVCTLKLVTERFLKPKKLFIIYNELTGKTLENAHNALADSRACGIIYPILRDMKHSFNRIGVSKVILKASEVASMINRNRFKTPHDVMMDLWCKYFPDTFKGNTKEQIAIKAIKTSDVAVNVLKDAEKFISTNSSSVEQKLRAVNNQLETQSGLEGGELDAAKDFIRKTLYTNHGIRHEEDTADLVDPEFIVDDKYYNIPVCKIRGTEYVLVGKIDRLMKNEDGSFTIIEIKNRANRLFKTVKEYEEIQCQAYMEMLDMESCRLIEQHNDNTCTHLIARDREKWNDIIMPKLTNFCEHFHNLVSN